MTNILLTPYDGAILGPVAKLLGYIMDGIFMFMHNVFGIENVGLSIIIFTIVIYTLMLPLTYKQQKFGKLNQAMQPEIKAIQEKYKGKRDEASGICGFGGCALQWQALRDAGTMGTVSLQQASVILP